MPKDDFNPDPLDPADPLSATGMFLNSFGSTPAQESSNADVNADVAKSLSETPATSSSGAETPRTDWSTAAHPAPPASGSGNPGEFTKMFQAMEQRPSPAPVSHTPIPSPAAHSTPPQGPGEFTRAFVAGSTPVAEQRAPDRPPVQQARTVIEPPAIPAPIPGPSRMKGFSTPGVSDSASGEGGFTQFFKATPSAPASTPPPVQSYKPVTPAAAPPPVPEKPWREPDFNTSAKPLDSSLSTTSATGLLSALSSPEISSSAPRQPEPTPYRPEPLPLYTPAPSPSEPSPAQSGSVTQLIQRLSQVPREIPVAAPAAPITAVAPPPVSSSFGEPGEFTRMISGGAVRNAPGNTSAAAPQPQPAAPPPPAAAPIAMPHVAVPAAPAIPAMHPPALPTHQAAPPPKFEAPKIEAPKMAPPAAPALAAPKSKLEALVPILLVINTFLLVVLLVVVIFALKAK